MIEQEERWNDSAEIYCELSPNISFYRVTSKQIVRMASLEMGMSVVDLGCGSACLSVIEMLRTVSDLRIVYCVDNSQAMLKQASRIVSFNNVKFIHSPAEELHTALSEEVDRVICNSAFWLFDLPRSLQAIRKVLLTTGYFLFNIADWDLKTRKLRCDPKYDAIDRQLVLRGLPKKQNRGSQYKISLHDLQDVLNNNGFCKIELSRFNVPVTSVDWSYFYQIPAIAKRSLPNIPLDIAMEVLHEAMGSLKNDELPPIRWITIKSQRE